MNAARLSAICATVAGCALLVGPAIVQPAPRLLFNTTASAPIGFYRLDRQSSKIGDWVVVRPPPVLANWMARRGYLPVNVPLLKRLAAVDGQRVCGHGGQVFVDGKPVAMARRRDRRGRALIAFDGCQRLAAGQVFLLNADAPGSFDGRYFGPLPAATITARATPLWVWRAS